MPSESHRECAGRRVTAGMSTIGSLIGSHWFPRWISLVSMLDLRDFHTGFHWVSCRISLASRRHCP